MFGLALFSRLSLAVFLACTSAAFGQQSSIPPPPPNDVPQQQPQQQMPTFIAPPPPLPVDALSWMPQGMSALSQQAAWHTDFTFDHTMLALAGSLAGVDDTTRNTIARLNGIAVHLYRFPATGSSYNPAVLDAVRAQYSALGWKHIVTANKFPDTHSNGQESQQGAPGQFIPSGPGRTDVWLQSHGVNFAGAAVLLAGPTNVNLIVVSGDISTFDLLHLRGHFGIPRFPDDALNH